MHEAPNGVRLDVWLDVSCLFKTRSDAKRACEAGRVQVNGQPGKAHRLLRPGDELRLARPFGREQTVVVKTLADRSIPKARARELYEDRTPPPTPAEVEARRLERLFRASQAASRPSDKRDRRALRRLKGGR